MQLSSSSSGVASSRSSFFAGRSLQSPASSWCLPASWRRCVLEIRSEKADFWHLLGGRGLPGGEEEVLKIESKTQAHFGAVKDATLDTASAKTAMPPRDDDDGSAANGFEKEMMGLTGGFPGGETGLQRFISTSAVIPDARLQLPPQQQPRVCPPPLLMPGMTVIVKNPRHAFYMYSGIVQRVSDGRVGVLFEGGNWDKLLTFYLEDLERTARGPPMTNPKSAILLQRSPPAPPR